MISLEYNVEDQQLPTSANIVMVYDSNRYLNPGESGMYYWSMTPAAFRYGFAGVWYEFAPLSNGNVADYIAVRPVINVTTDDGFTSGDGTASRPYTIS